MRDGIMLTVADDGTARVYDDTYDIVIHCESQEERDKAMEKLRGMTWIPCSERLPEEEGAYLVTVHPKHVSANVIRVDLIQWDREKWRFVDYGGEYVEYPYRITAWMPVVKPWEGDAE